MDAPTGSEKIVQSAMTGAFFGTAVGSIESVWTIPKLGSRLPRFSSQLKHIGGRAGVLSAAAGIYATAEYAATSIRQTKDPWNAAFGGAMAGLIPGILSKNGRFAFGSSLVCGVVMAASDIWADNTASPFEKFAEARTADRA